MNQVAYAKIQDALPTDRPAGPSIPQNVDALLGTWRNSNSASQGIASVEVSQQSSGVCLRVFGSGEEKPTDWGETTISNFFAAAIDSQQAISFTADYDFGFLETELQANLAKGLLIISSINKFKDGSSRSNYFAREFFYKESQNNQ